MQRAMDAIAEYRLVHEQAASYVALGYSTPEGQPAAVKLLEFLVIDQLITLAMRKRQKNERR
jgi:hypothetical protein